MRLSRPPIDSLTVDDLGFAVQWSGRRHTIGLTVARDGTLRVLAPAGVSARSLEAAVRAKLPWVRRKLAELEALGPPPAPKRLVDGELMTYLGRTYRLTLVDDPETTVALSDDRFLLATGLDGSARGEVVRWYTERGRRHLAARVAHFAPLVDATPSGLVVRDLGTRRWGTCDGRTRVVTFHWELMLQPRDAVDYVVVHELAHLREPHHQKAFWARVAAVMPDWKRRRALLAGQAGRHVI